MDRGLERMLAADARPGAACLDVGCGDGGTVGPWLQSRGCRYLGVDVSSNAVEMAAARGLDAKKIDDAGALPLPDDGFDLAICLEVLEHLFQPQVAAAETLRILKPGGVLVAAVPNVAYWRRGAELAVIGRRGSIRDKHRVH